VKFPFFSALLGFALAAPHASAQLMLPGALQAAPEAASQPTVGSAKSRPIAPKLPGEEMIVDRDLLRDGAQGSIALQRAPGQGLEIKTLSMQGEQISHPGEVCRIDVIAGEPIEAKPSGKPAGLLRYDVDVEACPFSFDIFDGAIRVIHEGKLCDFVAADCRIDPTGLWGPAGSSITDKQIKLFERARGSAETTMRTAFRALMARLDKDKAAITKIASEQAGFSSEREVACRNYAGEDAHGFCALRLTQGRVLALEAELAATAKDHGNAKPARTTKVEAKEAKP
jgi:hypothetical protein